MRSVAPGLGVLTGLTGVSLCLSCAGQSEVGHFTADVYEGHVACAEDGRACFDETGAEAPFETRDGFAFLTTETSQHHPDGLFVYFEVERGDGIVGRGELDIPLGPPVEDEPPTFAYTEERGGEVIFVAESARGVLEVPEEARGDECDCLDGRLELVFRDDEGAIVHLSRGRFGWEDRECIPRVRFTDLSEELVVLSRTCRDVGRVSTRESPPPVEEPDYERPRVSYPTGSASCEGGSGCTSDGGGGCEGDTGGGGCDGGGGGGGCEGDAGGAGCSGDAGGAGCGGDVGGAGCAGDAGSCRVGGRRTVGPRGPQQTGVLVALALAWALRPRRRG